MANNFGPDGQQPIDRSLAGTLSVETPTRIIAVNTEQLGNPSIITHNE